MSQADVLFSAAELVASNLHVIDELVDRCKTFYTGTINHETAVHWILQFGEPNKVSVALKLLKNIHFIDEPALASLIKRAFEQMPLRAQQHSFLAPVGKSYDSGAVVGYSFSKALALNENELASRWVDVTTAFFSELPVDRPLVLIDDNITSGVQITRFFGELFPDFKGEREHFERPLSSPQLEQLKRREIHLLFAAELSEGREHVIEFAQKYNLSIRVYSGIKILQRNLEHGSSLWQSQAESEYAKTIIRDISSQLFRDKSNWDDTTRNDRVFGYGNLQKLVVFSHNVPKSLLTPLWKFGEYNGKSWVPLFPERHEWDVYNTRIQDPEPSLRVVAQLVSSGAFGKTAPACSAHLCIEGEPTDSITLSLPGERACTPLFELHTRRLPVPAPIPRKNLPPGIAFPAIGPSDEDIRIYNNKLVQYRDELKEYKGQLKTFLNENVCIVELPVRVYNIGTGRATEVVLEIELSDSVVFMPRILPIPRPPRPPAVPQDRFSKIASTSRPDLSLLADISDKLDQRDEASGSEHVQILKDRGKRILRVYFRKVLQGSFRDRTIRYLRLPRSTVVHLNTKILCEEASRPIEKTFILATNEASVLPRHLADAWTNNGEGGDESEDDDS